MNDKIKFALIGCGAISRKHIEALDRIEDAEVAAVVDKNLEAAKAVGEKYGIPYYDDRKIMAEEHEIDVLNILTPSGDHARRIFENLDLKKHYIVEKPLALRLVDVDDVLYECDRNNLKIFVVQQNRFNIPVTKLKAAIDQGRFGKFVLGTVRLRWSRNQEYYDAKEWRGTWAFDGGVITNQASHSIDLLIWLMGPVESVIAKTATRLVDIETEDTAGIILKFVNGAIGIIEATTATRPKDLECSVSILGEKASVEIGGFFMNRLKTWNFTDHQPEDDEMLDKYAENPPIYAWNHEQFFRNVIDCIKYDKKALVDGIEARKSIELINAIYESSETGSEVYLHFNPKACKLGIPLNS